MPGPLQPLGTPMGLTVGLAQLRVAQMRLVTEWRTRRSPLLAGAALPLTPSADPTIPDRLGWSFLRKRGRYPRFRSRRPGKRLRYRRLDRRQIERLPKPRGYKLPKCLAPGLRWSRSADPESRSGREPTPDGRINGAVSMGLDQSLPAIQQSVNADLGMDSVDIDKQLASQQSTPGYAEPTQTPTTARIGRVQQLQQGLGRSGYAADSTLANRSPVRAGFHGATYRHHRRADVSHRHRVSRQDMVGIILAVPSPKCRHGEFQRRD